MPEMFNNLKEALNKQIKYFSNKMFTTLKK